MTISAFSCPFYEMKESVEKNKRIVKDEKTGFIYRSGDSNDVLRKKFIILFFASLTIALPVRLTTRSFLLISGLWICSGYEKTQTIWAKKCYDSYHLKLPPPPHSDYYRILAKEIGIELLDHIVKCVTLPLALIGLTFAAFWGLIFPLDGRGLYSDIERTWSLNIPHWVTDSTIFVYSNFIAICMQPLQTWKELNLFRFTLKYDPIDARSILYKIERLNYQGFMELEDAPIQAWKVAIEDPQTFNQKERVEELLKACEELNVLIVAQSTPEILENAQKRKQAAIEDFLALP